MKRTPHCAAMQHSTAPRAVANTALSVPRLGGKGNRAVPRPNNSPESANFEKTSAPKSAAFAEYCRHKKYWRVSKNEKKTGRISVTRRNFAKRKFLHKSEPTPRE